MICSPNAAKSQWVNKEIADFIEIGKAKGIDNVRNIFPFIICGHPHAKNHNEECFPQVLLNLPDSLEVEHDKAEKERKEREERERFLRIQSRLVGEKAINIQNNTSLAQRIALEVLPKDYPTLIGLLLLKQNER